MALLNFESFDYYDTTYYGYIFCKMMGLWPLTWRPGMKTNIFIDCLIIAPWLLGLSYFAYDNVTSYQFWNDFYQVTDSFILTWGSRLQNLACLVLAIIIILMTSFQSFFGRSNFHKLFNCVVYVDKILENEFYCDMQFELCAKILFVLSAALFVSILCFFVLSYFVFERMLGLVKSNFYVSFFFANLPFVTTITTFIVFTMSLRSRFIFINDIFSLMRDDEQNVFVYDQTTTISTITKTPPVDSRPLCERVKDLFYGKSCMKQLKITKTTSNIDRKHFIDRLVHVHSKLCDCISLMNELTSFKLLLATIYMFVFIVFACFTGYRVMYHSHTKGDVVAIADIFWMGYYIGLMIGITTSASLTSNAARYTGRIVHKVIHKAWDPVIIQRLTIASQQLLMRNPVFTCYFFSFNWKLLFAMVSANTTYLVFLIQLDIASKNKSMKAFNGTLNGSALDCKTQF